MPEVLKFRGWKGRLAVAALLLPALMPTAGQAQSVLESVLAKLEIGQATLLPLLAANMAINSGWSTAATSAATARDDALVAVIYGEYFDPDSGTWGTQQWGIYKSDLGTTLSAADTLFMEDIHVEADGTIWAQDSDSYTDTFTVFDATGALFGADGLLFDTGVDAALDILPEGTGIYTDGTAQYYLRASSAEGYDTLSVSYDDIFMNTVIDASVTNRVTGADRQVAAIVTDIPSLAIHAAQVDIGDISTTGLGAVNAGQIVLGVSSSVDQAMAAGTEAVSGRVKLIGTTFGETAMVWNEAYNDTRVIAHVENAMAGISGAVGSISTTALGAVNTGAITSGIGATIRGVVGQSGL